jgi:peptidoglycan/LPS O-acetylase OafA/YrhL
MDRPVSVLEIEPSETDAPADLPVIDFSRRIPGLDGLRGIAILLVLLCHSIFDTHPQTPLGSHLLAIGRLTWSGVDLFFVLSGFLIGGILLDSKNSPSYFKTFYIRRAYRILPLYGVLVMLFSLRYIKAASAGPLGSFSHSSIPWLAYVTFTQNVWMALWGTFGAGVMASTWSLAVEEQFYLSAPFLVRSMDRSRLTYALLSVLIAAPLGRTALHFLFPHGNFACYVLMPCRADALSAGVLCATLVRTPRWAKLLFSPRRSALIWMAGFLALGLVPLTIWGDGMSTPMVTIGYSWVALFYSTCLLIVITKNSTVPGGVLTNRYLMQLGGLAYCTYLFHLPLMEACRRLLGLRFSYSSEGTQFVGGLVGILLTLVVAKFSWTFFEKPLLRRGHAYKY